MSVTLVKIIDYFERRRDRIDRICERAAAEGRSVDLLIEEIVEIDDLLADVRLEMQVRRILEPHGTTAVSVGAAETFYEAEAGDPLPPGRLKHDAYNRLSARERREAALAVLRATTDWVSPLFWATAHSDDVRARVYWRGALAREFCDMHREGLVQRRTTGKRGALYEYRLIAEQRLVSVAS